MKLFSQKSFRRFAIIVTCPLWLLLLVGVAIGMAAETVYLQLGNLIDRLGPP